MVQFYLAVFVIGFSLTVLSFLFGAAGHSFGDLHGHGASGDGGHGTHSHGLPWLNFGTATAFLTWFGGVGFLLSAYSGVVALLTVLIALLFGLGGSAMVFLFMQKVLVRDQVPMRAADYYLPGTLGRVTVSIPRDGTGEIVYAQAGARKTAAARCVDGRDVARGTEVVVLRYERGIAHVRPWDQMGADTGQQQQTKS